MLRASLTVHSALCADGGHHGGPRKAADSVGSPRPQSKVGPDKGFDGGEGAVD